MLWIFGLVACLFVFSVGACAVLEKMPAFAKLKIRLDEQVFLGTLLLTALSELAALYTPLTVPVRVSLLSVSFLFGLVFFFKKLKNKRFSRFEGAMAIVFVLGIVAISLRVFDVKFGYDTRTYHLMTVRWMHEGGTITGLANLDGRLGFNSAFLSLAALVDVDGRSPFYVNVFVYATLLLSALLSVRSLSKTFSVPELFTAVASSVSLTDFSLVASLYQEPYSALVTILIIRWMLKYAESRDENLLVLMAVAGAFSMLVKRNLAFLAVLSVLFAVFYLLKSRAPKRIWGLLFLSGLLFCAPNVFRSVLLSGYPLFPVTAISVPVSWRVPPALAKNNLITAQVNRRAEGIPMEQKFAMSRSEWMPLWLAKNGKKLREMALLFSVSALLIVLAWYRQIRNSATQPAAWFVTAMAVLSLPLLTLQQSAHLRYIEHWIGPVLGLGIALFAGSIKTVFEKSTSKRMLTAILMLVIGFLLFRNLGLNRPGGATHFSKIFVEIPSHPPVDFQPFTNARGNVFFVPATGEWSYYHFPLPTVSRIDTARHRFINSVPAYRGETVFDGFYTLKPELVLPFGQ